MNLNNVVVNLFGGGKQQFRDDLPKVITAENELLTIEKKDRDNPKNAQVVRTDLFRRGNVYDVTIVWRGASGVTYEDDVAQPMRNIDLLPWVIRNHMKNLFRYGNDEIWT